MNRYPTAIRHVTWWAAVLMREGDDPARHVPAWQCEHRHQDEASALACAEEKANVTQRRPG